MGKERYTLSVSPDIGPDKIAGWYIFNTWMQRQWGQAIHLAFFPNFQAQRHAIRQNEVHLIYANPFDAAMLVREKNFTALAAPAGKYDEVVIAVKADSPVKVLEDLPVQCRAALTDAPDVNMISTIMLEPANISHASLQTMQVDTYVVVAKQLLQDKVDVGFFLAEAFDNLSAMVRSQLRVLIRSEIHDVRHVLLADPRLENQHETLRELLSGMTGNTKGRDALANLGFTDWDMIQQEDTEFMIDLMDTLVS